MQISAFVRVYVFIAINLSTYLYTYLSMRLFLYLSDYTCTYLYIHGSYLLTRYWLKALLEQRPLITVLVASRLPYLTNQAKFQCIEGVCDTIPGSFPTSQLTLKGANFHELPRGGVFSRTGVGRRGRAALSRTRLRSQLTNS